MTPKEPHRPVGAPEHPIVDPTPLPMMGDRLDVEGTLRRLYRDINDVKQIAADPSIEKKLGLLQKVGISLGIVFSGGVGYAIVVDETATDAEVNEAVERATIHHNGGIDPKDTDSETHEPVGHHPELRKAVESNTKAIKEIQEDLLPRMEHTQIRMDKRTEYQFEFSRWQADVTEAERRRKKPPPKPKRLEELERDLLLLNY